MAAAVRVRGDYDAGRMRELAKRSADAAQTRRLLALAAIYDGGSRTEAAKIGGVGLQTVRDWVLALRSRARYRPSTSGPEAAARNISLAATRSQISRRDDDRELQTEQRIVGLPAQKLQTDRKDARSWFGMTFAKEMPAWRATPADRFWRRAAGCSRKPVCRQLAPKRPIPVAPRCDRVRLKAAVPTRIAVTPH